MVHRLQHTDLYRSRSTAKLNHFVVGIWAGFLLLSGGVGHTQNQNLADSLELVLAAGDYAEEDYLSILFKVAGNHTDPDKKLEYSRQLIDAAAAAGSDHYRYKGYMEQGTAYRLKSDLANALESYFVGARIVSEEGNLGEQAKIFVAIADVYSIMGNHQNATRYYEDAIEILRTQQDTITLASALLNAGDEYFNYGSLDSALLYFRESEALCRQTNFELGVAYNLGNLGLVYAEQGRDELAENNIRQAVQYLESLEDYYPISVYLLYMADIYLRRGNTTQAINYVQRSLEMARQYGLKEQVSEANLKLSEIYQQTGDWQRSLDHYKQFIVYRDSVQNLDAVQQMADLRTDFEVSQKQGEIDLLEKEAEIQHLRQSRQRKFNYAAGIALLFFLLLAFGLYRRYRYISRTTAIIEEEQQRSDQLLQNILPAETARELKESGKVQARKFDSVTVLFTDFKEFTTYSEQLSPEKLVESIDVYFSKFDEIMEQYGLEKIKTVGDAYMCAGGVPFPTPDHAEKMVRAALDILDFVQTQAARDNNDLARFEVRIGINTGPVIAGVVGTKKFAYDIWGDTVNIAARMETTGETGKVNIAENTYQLIKDTFHCTYRGEVDVRYKGKMKMYFVEGKKAG